MGYIKALEELNLAYFSSIIQQFVTVRMRDHYCLQFSRQCDTSPNHNLTELQNFIYIPPIVIQTADNSFLKELKWGKQ